MALPANGGTYDALFQPGLDELAVRKWIVTDLIMRDYRDPDGLVRNLADPAIGLNDDGVFSPFALDGTVRSDLLGDSGLGFYHLGSLHEDGLAMKSDTSVDETMIAQSKRPARVDVTKDDDEITIKAVEGTPVIDALRYDKPLANLADVGKKGYYVAKDAETVLIERQVIALGYDQENLVAQVFPRMSLKSRGDTNWNKKDPDTMELTLSALLCPYVQSPSLLFREGKYWRALQGAPVFAADPVATAVTGGKANIVFAKPTSKSSTYEFVVEKSNDGATGWTTATPVSTTGTDPVTIQVSGVTSSATWYFRVKVTGSAGITTTSAVTAPVVGLS